MVTVAMIPVGSIVSIIGLYVVDQEQYRPLWCVLFGFAIAGLMFGILYWLYLAFHFNTAQHASVLTYNDLCERMHRVASVEPLEPDETLFDKEAREARERLRDPERLERAKAEGWTTPTDEAGTSDRWG